MSVLDEGAHIELSHDSSPSFPMGKPSKLTPNWMGFHKKHYEPTYSEMIVYVLHPFRKGYLGLARNKYGKVISVHRCSSCLTRFSVCGAEPNFGDCQSDECSSYDPHGDVSFLLSDSGGE